MNSNRAADPRSGPSRWVNPRRTDRRAPRLREIDLNSLPYRAAAARAAALGHTIRSRAPADAGGRGSFRASRCALATGLDREVGLSRAP